MSRVDTLVSRMRYWCEQANLGYDQSQRWDIRVGGECDCSSLVYWCLWEAGYLAKPEGNLYGYTLYTGTLLHDLTSAGWTAVKPNGSPQPGYVVLNETHHVAVCTGPNGQLSMASIDERGKASGGSSGDQTDLETKTRSYYDYPWDWYLIPPDESGSVGWQQDGKGWWYRDSNGGYPADEWRSIDGHWYHFDRDGYAQTGWVSEGDNWYYFRPHKDDAGPECSMVIGWCELDGFWYYFQPLPDSPEGAMVHSVVKWINDAYYAFGQDGRMITTAIPVDSRGRLQL